MNEVLEASVEAIRSVEKDEVGNEEETKPSLHETDLRASGSMVLLRDNPTLRKWNRELALSSHWRALQDS